MIPLYVQRCQGCKFEKGRVVTMATLKEVAERAGVSHSTAARVLRGDLGLVGASTAARVRKAARELRYHPSAAAKALARGRTETVAVAYQYPHLNHYRAMLAAARCAIERHGYHMLHIPVDSSNEMQLSLVLAERRADVLVLAAVHGEYEAAEWIVEPHQMVVVAKAFRAPDLPPIPTAYWENEEGFRAVICHLADLGHERITYLGGGAGHTDTLFEACASERRLSYDIEISGSGGVPDMVSDGLRMARAGLARSPRPTALVARNDDFAIGAMHAAWEMGLRVPQDVSIVGYYDTPICPFTQPPLTSVATPFADCVSAVIESALTAIEDGTQLDPQAAVVKYHPRLVTRASTDSILAR